MPEDSPFDLRTLFDDPSKRSKTRASEIGSALSDGRLTPGALVDFARSQSGTAQATCLEGLESATKSMPDMIDSTSVDFLCEALDDVHPGVKREAARIVGNVARRPSPPLEAALDGLLKNATHEGTVVRWAAAFALGQILSHRPELRDNLAPRVRHLSQHEENSGVKKHYLKGLGHVR